MALEHASSGKVVDLSPLKEKLRDTVSTALVKTDTFEAIRLVVPSGDLIPPHQVAEKFILHCLEGRVRIDLPNDSVELLPNQWVYFDEGIMHSVEGIEDSSLLLTVMLRKS